MATPSTHAAIHGLHDATNLTTPDGGGDGGGVDGEWRFDDNLQRRFLGTYFLIVFVVGTAGNSLVITAVSLTKKLQNATNIFVANLAVADLLHCIFLPFMIHDLYQPMALVMPNPILCGINGVLTVLFLSVSVFSHAIIALTRYVMITKTRRVWQVTFTPRRISLFVAAIWMVSSVDPILSIAGVTPLGFNPKYGICSRDIRIRSSVILSSVRSVYTNLFSVAVVTFCYAKVFIFVRRHNRSALRRILTSSSAGSTISRKLADEMMESKGETSVFDGRGEETDGCIMTTHGAGYPLDDVIDTNGENKVHPLNGGIQTISYMNFSKPKSVKEPIFKIRTEKDTPNAANASVDDEKILPGQTPGHSSSGDASSRRAYSNAPSRDCGSRPTGDRNPNGDLPVAYDTGRPATGPSQESTCDRPIASCEVHPRQAQSDCGTNEVVTPNKTTRSFRDKAKSSLRRRFRRSHDRRANDKKEIDITKKLFIVVCVFFACVLPYVFFVSIKSLERFLPYAATVQASSSCLNPIIYGLSHPQFQHIFSLIVSCRLSKIPKPTRLLKWMTKCEVLPRRNVDEE